MVRDATTRKRSDSLREREVHAVIGANFGDEAKGLVTDALAARMGPDALVVRFNGGAQAGHTVTTPEGRRHVFGHFGSGSFVGCDTFLSRFFVCNPMTFLKERAALARLGLDPVVFVDPLAPVTTPYDMILNQWVEDRRALRRHGSCGLGFGETVERHARAAYSLAWGYLQDAAFLRGRLLAIREEWVPARMESLGLDKDMREASDWMHLLVSNAIMEKFVEDAVAFHALTRIAHGDVMARRPRLVFEGAQGLLLDPAYGWFPHVTRSNTGLRNVLALAQEEGIDSLHVHYLTRSYLTRHGAGPLPHEQNAPPYTKIVDLTNRPNPYQGGLRFGLLDLDLLGKTIALDGEGVPATMDLTRHVFVSCMDQIDERAVFFDNGALCRLAPTAFLARVQEKIKAESVFASYGPTRKTAFMPLAKGTVPARMRRRA